MDTKPLQVSCWRGKFLPQTQEWYSFNYNICMRCSIQHYRLECHLPMIKTAICTCTSFYFQNCISALSTQEHYNITDPDEVKTSKLSYRTIHHAETYSTPVYLLFGAIYWSRQLRVFQPLTSIFFVSVLDSIFAKIILWLQIQAITIKPILTMKEILGNKKTPKIHFSSETFLILMFGYLFIFFFFVKFQVWTIWSSGSWILLNSLTATSYNSCLC